MCTYKHSFSNLNIFYVLQWSSYQGQQDHGMGAGPSVNNYMLGWLPYDTNSIWNFLPFFFFHFLTFLFSKTLSSALRLHYDMLLSLYSVLCACVCYVYYVGLQWNNFFNIICYFSYDSANTRILSQYNLRRCSIYTCPSSDLFYVQ